MGKQGKGKTNGTKPRAAPYVKKATVDVHYEGDAPATASKSKSQVTVPLPISVSAPALAPAPAPAAKSEKAKGKQRASTTTAIPGSFIIVAGSYEKLLYGIEGAYPPAGEDSGDGLVNKVVKPNLTPIFIFPAHLAFVKAIAASPGGKWLATGSEDEFIKVWDLRRRKEVGSLSQHTGRSRLFGIRFRARGDDADPQGSITSLHFPTSSHLLSTSVDGTISLFRTSDWSLLKSLKGHSGRVNCVDVHPTGRVALSVGKDLTLKMWDLMRGRGAASLPLGIGTLLHAPNVGFANMAEAEQVKFSPLGTHFAVLFPKKIEIYSLALVLLNTLETKSRYNSLLFAEVDLDGLPVEVLCVGTEKGVVEIYDVDIVDIDPEDADEEKEKDEADEEEDEEEDEDKPTQMAEVERIGTLVGHTNRIKSISAISHTIPANPPLATTLLSTASSDGFINLYDLTQVFAETDKAEKNTIEAVGRYDTKGSRLTCVFLADGRKERVEVRDGDMDGKGAEEVADEDDAADEEEDEDMYDSTQEAEAEEEDEDEDEDEDEGEYE